MTDKEAMQQALEALNRVMSHGSAVQRAKDILRERLAQPEQCQYPDCKCATESPCLKGLAQPEQEPFGYFRYDLRLDAWVQNREGRLGTPFYAAPPQRKPLTDEQIDALPLPPSGTATVRDLVRIIEAAHGIKGEA